MEYLKITDFELEYQGEQLFKIANLNVQAGQRIGLIGENGVGKTTLLKTIANEPIVFNISGKIQRNCSIVMVPQILTYDEESGGEKEKAAINEALGQLQTMPNSLLLLDEPTANLDIDQQEWLIGVLTSMTSPLLVISHDRHFLKRVVNTVWLLQDKQVTEFKGTFAHYLETIAHQSRRQKVEYQENKKAINKLKQAQIVRQTQGLRATKKKANISQSDWKSRGYASGTERRLLRKSKVLKQRIAEKTANLHKPRTRKAITLANVQNSALTLPQNSNLLRIEPQTVQIAQRKLFQIDEQLKVKNGTKIALTGPNGSGKSVFLTDLVERRLHEWVNPKVKIGFFQQNMSSEAENTATLEEEIRRTSMFNNTLTMQLLGDLHLRPFLTHQVNQLSGGQLICFKLAKVLLGQHNFLLLDEPTNFLDVEAITAVEEFLRQYPFAVIVVSHDQEFLTKLGFQNWRIHNSQLELPTTFVNKKNTQKDNQLNLLKFRLDQMMADSEAGVAEMQKLKQQIADLENN